MSYCSLLTLFPDISKWNTQKVSDMSWMFSFCSELSSLPEISKWNMNNVNDISYMFYKCKALISLPDLSIWDLKNASDMNFVFDDCPKLSVRPKLTKKNNNNNKNNNKNNNNDDIGRTKQKKDVSISRKQYDILIAQYGKERIDRLINRLDLYKKSTGKRYKDDYATLLLWVETDLEKEKKNTNDNSKLDSKEMRLKNLQEKFGENLEKLYANYTAFKE